MIPIYCSVIPNCLKTDGVCGVAWNLCPHTSVSDQTPSMGPHHPDSSWSSIAYGCLTPLSPSALCPVAPFIDPVLQSKLLPTHQILPEISFLTVYHWGSLLFSYILPGLQDSGQMSLSSWSFWTMPTEGHSLFFKTPQSFAMLPFLPFSVVTYAHTSPSQLYCRLSEHEPSCFSLCVPVQPGPVHHT